MRLLAVLLLAACYPVCVSDADCDRGYCQIMGQKRQCISCDPDGDECGDGFTCAADGTCQPVTSDDGGSD